MTDFEFTMFWGMVLLAVVGFSCLCWIVEYKHKQKMKEANRKHRQELDRQRRFNSGKIAGDELYKEGAE